MWRSLARRMGLDPWERYVRVNRADVVHQVASVGLVGSARDGSVTDDDGAPRVGTAGRALVLGSGRGVSSVMLTSCGWEVVGLEPDRAAVRYARGRALNGFGEERVRFAAVTVPELPGLDLGEFDLFLDLGFFHRLASEERLALGREMAVRARPRAEVLMLELGPSPVQRVFGGISRDHVVADLPEWELVSAHLAPTAGLPWPLRRAQPRWYRFELR